MPEFDFKCDKGLTGGADATSVLPPPDFELDFRAEAWPKKRPMILKKRRETFSAEQVSLHKQRE